MVVPFALLPALLFVPLTSTSSALPQRAAFAMDAMLRADTTKDGSALAKATERPKIKACCGYPLSLPRGFKLSFYWLAWESEYANEPYDTAVYTRQGFFLGRFPRTLVYELKLEGSGILRDGRVINYDGECDYGIGVCFKQVDPHEHPVGMGGQGRPLEPLRSVAIDPRLIPIGTPLYIPELRGIRMPDGSRHDGCVRADDTGGNIKQRKVDFFVESYAGYKSIADNMWWDSGITPMVEEPRCLYLRSGDPSRGRDNEHADWIALHQHPARPVRLAKASASLGHRRATATRKSVAVAKNTRTTKGGHKLAHGKTSRS